MDPTRAFLESLLQKLGNVGTIFSYSAYERSALNGLGEQFTDLADQIKLLLTRKVELYPIVRGHYYHPNMRGSFSLKKVLPNISIPLNSYEHDGIKNGREVMDAVRKILKLREDIGPSAEAECRRITHSIQRYVAADTFALSQLARFLAGKPYNSPKP
jgi:hypothetical protein